MKSKKGLFPAIFIVFIILSIAITGVAASVEPAEAENSELYYSETAGPIIYGATKITMGLNAVDNFDCRDARFRAFARDFEDGDIGITATGDTNFTPAANGVYNIKYTATDSHGNVAERDVPIVISGSGDDITVERTLYTIPNDYYMDLSGTRRNNNGDRQILGVFLPKGKGIKVKLEPGSPNMAVAFLNDDQNNESAVTLTAADYSDFKEIKNSKDFDSVPLMSTVKLARYADIRTTYKITVQYSANEANPLHYYHYGDDEDAFKADWEEDITRENYTDANGGNQVKIEGEFAVAESTELMLLMPARDIDGDVRFQFSSYDEHFAYYRQVVEKMDKIIGLSYDAEEPYNQNIRAKYLVKANVHGAGAAYYSGNHVGIHSSSMASFFEMNWGGLHEIAHGYQGLLGGGTMGIGETSNNILGHYIQMDTDIWKAQSNGKSPNGKWLGELIDCENGWNKKRLEGNDYNSKYFGENPGGKLYALINLFDNFDGWETYSRIFRYLRAGLSDGRITSTGFNQQEFFARFFYDEYNVNIVPYWTQWGLEVSEEVMEYVAEGKNFSILSDSAGEKADEILSGEGESLRYGLVSDGTLKKYGVTADLTVTVGNEDGKADGKTILLQREGETVGQRIIKDGKAEFSGLYAGGYFMILPVIQEYEAENRILTIEPGENSYAAEYSPIENVDYHPTTLRVAGIYGNSGYELALSERNKKGAVIVYPADLGNRNGYWTTDEAKNEVYLSITVYDGEGNEVNRREARGNNYFTLQANERQEIDLDYGYRVEIITHAAKRIHVRSQITGEDLKEYDDLITGSESIVSYLVTEAGFQPIGQGELDVSGVLYSARKDKIVGELDKMQEELLSEPDSLQYKYKNRGKKAEFLQMYEALNEEDRAAYSEIAEKIIKGGAPNITVLQAEFTANEFESVDWSEIVSATDNEDGHMTLSKEYDNIRVQGYDGGKGTYDLTVYITDSDGNVTPCSIKCHINEPAGDEKSGLSTGAIVGIAIGCAFVVAAVVTVILIVVKKRIKQK